MALGAQREQIGAQFLSLGLRLLAAGTISVWSARGWQEEQCRAFSSASPRCP